jgi:flagellar basal-body rod modification protein FlgD
MEVNGASGIANLISPQNASDRADLNKEQFLQILITELTNQDPLEPMDNSDFLNQLVTMELQNAQQLVTSSSLIGKVIYAVRETGEEVVGTVDSVTMKGGKAELNIGEQSVGLSLVREIA